MITHVVLMKLKEKSQVVAETMRDRLMGLPAHIEQIQHYEVGINMVDSERNYDVVLISKFDSLEDMDIYQVHPEHQDVLAYIREQVQAVSVVDYES